MVFVFVLGGFGGFNWLFVDVDVVLNFVNVNIGVSVIVSVINNASVIVIASSKSTILLNLTIINMH